MHYTTNYEGLDPIAKHDKAITDILEWMGKDRFDKATSEFRKHNLTLEQFELYASFAGVQGYSVKAWYNYCYPL